MLWIVDKPSGLTSFDVVRKFQKLYPEHKIGHSGTLDPMASWVLLIGIWKDTKRLWEYQRGTKTYVATVDFSKQTDTWDLDYWQQFEEYEINPKPLGIKKDWKIIKAPSKEQIKKFLNSLKWEQELPLPPFSAKKIKGKRLYELAREWKQMKLTKKMNIHNIEILDYKFPLLKIKVEVGGGTYIRSLAFVIGQHFGLGGILTYLRRVQVWNIKLR